MNVGFCFIHYALSCLYQTKNSIKAKVSIRGFVYVYKGRKSCGLMDRLSQHGAITEVLNLEVQSVIIFMKSCYTLVDASLE